VGDPVYGAATSRRIAGIAQELPMTVLDVLQQFSRQALHATQIRFIHPMTEESMCFDCPYPEDMRRLLREINTL
jgi:23S rRNA pseudouridine1911/1915/1917 synthase